MRSSNSPTWCRACAISPTPAPISFLPPTPWSICPISSQCCGRSSASWRQAACWPSPWKRMAATASFLARACAMPTVLAMCARRSAMPGLRWRGVRICRPATRTTRRCPVSSRLRRKPEDSFPKACFKSGAACMAKAASSLLPGTRKCRSMRASQGETKTMNNNQSRRDFCATAIATIFASATSVRAAEKKYDPGASDTEIKIGQTVPHSGPGSLYGVLGRVGEAYFQMLNENGGINGRKVKFFTMDDAYSAPKCVEATRRLVEQEEVLALFGSLGTAPPTAVHKYLNSKGVPQLLLNTGASKWNDPKNNKWTMAGLPLDLTG